MANELKKACVYLGVDRKKVIAHKLCDDYISVVVDNGIKGCPKYNIPLTDLPADEVEPAPKKDTVELEAVKVDEIKARYQPPKREEKPVEDTPKKPRKKRAVKRGA